MGETVFQSNFTYKNRGWTPGAVVFSPLLRTLSVTGKLLFHMDSWKNPSYLVSDTDV